MMKLDEQRPQQKRVMPQSELDFHLMTTDTLWGSKDVDMQLQEKLSQYKVTRDDKGEQLFDSEGNALGTKRSLLSDLSFYKRDLRLANLSAWNGEIAYCQYYLDLATDFLNADLGEPFLICLSRAVSVLELSQSKNGFLRKTMNTMRQEHLSGELEPPKKTLFGKNKKQDGGF